MAKTRPPYTPEFRWLRVASCHAIASHMTKSRSASRFVERFRGFGAHVLQAAAPGPPNGGSFLGKLRLC
jgi:hypothetical protein